LDGFFYFGTALTAFILVNAVYSERRNATRIFMFRGQL